MKGFERSDSSELGFAVAALIYSAISIEEFQQWVLAAIERSTEPSALLVDLLEFQGPPADVLEVIGFQPEWPLPSGSKTALAEIAIRRGKRPSDCAIPKAKAAKCFDQFPEVAARFRITFPAAGF